MVMQLDLFARATDPDTSQALSPDARRTIKVRICEVFNRHPLGLTAEQVASLIPDRPASSVVTAVSQVARDGYIVDTGKRSLNERGRWVIVWGPA